MLLPNGNCVWKELHTFFVDIRSLMRYIRSFDFNGYIYCRFQKNRATIFLDEGDSVCGVLENGGLQVRGMDVVKEILGQMKKEDNIYLDVYTLPNRSVKIITELFLAHATTFQANLNADFFNIESYINNHLNSFNFSGYVEIKFTNGDEGIVSLQEGIFHSIITDTLQIRKDRAKRNELKVFDMYALKLFQRAKSEGAKYTINEFIQ